MCELTTIAMVGSLIASGVGAVSAVQQGQAQSAQAKYQASVNRENAKASQWQADDARVRGQQEEVAQRRKTGLLLESQKTALAGQGFSMGDSTASDILADTATLGEIDAQTIRQNAERNAWGFEQQRNNYNNNASLNSMAASNYSTAGWMNATSSLFSGASSVADKWVTYKNKGI